MPEDAKLVASVNAGNPKKLKARTFVLPGLGDEAKRALGKPSLRKVRKSTAPQEIDHVQQSRNICRSIEAGDVNNPNIPHIIIIIIYPDIMGHCPSGWWWHHQRPVCAGALKREQDYIHRSNMEAP